MNKEIKILDDEGVDYLTIELAVGELAGLSITEHLTRSEPNGDTIPVAVEAGILLTDEKRHEVAKALAPELFKSHAKAETAAALKAFVDEVLECGYKVQIEGLGFSKANVVNETRIKQIAAKHGVEVA